MAIKELTSSGLKGPIDGVNQMDVHFMNRALDLARRARPSTLPNPRVGALIVANSKIIAEGYHRGPGQAHAELEAIRNAEARSFKNFRKATLYVSLEPCCHTQKRTPPCAPLLIEKRFARVVVASLDPNPLVAGKGIRALRKAGIEVEVGCQENQALMLNQAFFKNQQTHLPYIQLKLAMSFDGKLADDFGKSKWITADKARKWVHALRAQACAIGIGKNTIDIDNPQLNVRRGKKESPRKILIFGRPKTPLSKLKVSKANGLERIFIIPKGPLKPQLKKLYEQHRICQILFEGGAQLASTLLREGLVDELFLLYGRGFIGGQGLYSLGRSWRLKALDKSTRFSPESARLLDHDVLIQGRLHVYGNHPKSRKNS